MAQQYRIRPQYRRHRREGLTPGLGKSPGGGNGNALQYSCLENPNGERSLKGYSRKESDTTAHTAHSETGVFALLMSKGHLLDTCAGPVSGSVVPISLS